MIGDQLSEPVDLSELAEIHQQAGDISGCLQSATKLAEEFPDLSEVHQQTEEIHGALQGAAKLIDDGDFPDISDLKSDAEAISTALTTAAKLIEDADLEQLESMVELTRKLAGNLRYAVAQAERLAELQGPAE